MRPSKPNQKSKMYFANTYSPQNPYGMWAKIASKPHKILKDLIRSLGWSSTETSDEFAINSSYDDTIRFYGSELADNGKINAITLTSKETWDDLEIDGLDIDKVPSDLSDKAKKKMVNKLSKRAFSGDDYLFSGEGNSYLKGLGGDDVIEAAKTNNKLKGGKGADTFILGGPDSYYKRYSTILDFQKGLDKIGVAQNEMFGIEFIESNKGTYVVGAMGTLFVRGEKVDQSDIVNADNIDYDSFLEVLG